MSGLLRWPPRFVRPNDYSEPQEPLLGADLTQGAFEHEQIGFLQMAVGFKLRRRE